MTPAQIVKLYSDLEQLPCHDDPFIRGIQYALMKELEKRR